ncbi:MAG: hypothetical protein NTY06_03085, partial [Candidatus Gottesmanbacteria bacterium]|nr:hypothetical protein [Candidatus Gottesmanbacteria bacterium]
METKVSEVDELKEKIAARIAFLKKVTDFAMSITEERGEMFPSSTVTHINRRLLSFGRFSFMVDLDQLGINVVQIWFRPKIYI